MIHVSGHVLLTSNKDLSSFRFFGDMDIYAHQVILLKTYPQTDFFQIKENKNFYVILTAKFNAFFAGIYHLRTWNAHTAERKNEIDNELSSLEIYYSSIS